MQIFLHSVSDFGKIITADIHFHKALHTLLSNDV